MAKVIFTNGVEQEVSPKNGTDFSLEEMQGIVGGYIEIMPLDKTGEIMVLNEEGKLMRLPLNEKATDYFLQNSLFDDFIVGNVLVCNSIQVK